MEVPREPFTSCFSFSVHRVKGKLIGNCFRTTNLTYHSIVHGISGSTPVFPGGLKQQTSHHSSLASVSSSFLLNLTEVVARTCCCCESPVKRITKSESATVTFLLFNKQQIRITGWKGNSSLVTLFVRSSFNPVFALNHFHFQLSSTPHSLPSRVLA